MINSSYLRAIATVSGFIIGAGIFGVPYIFSKSGLLAGLLELALIAGALVLAHLLYGEVILRTSGRHRLVGFAGRYLGNSGKVVASASNVLGAVGALLAYTILGGVFLWQLLGSVLPLSLFSFQLLFFGVMAVLVISGLKFVSRVEGVLTFLLFAVILGIVAWSAPHARVENLLGFDFKNIFLPFGVLMFALGGWAAVPEARDILEGEPSKLRGAIVWGTLAASGITAIFGASVLAVSGPKTTEAAIAGLVPELGYGVVVAGAIFGLLAISTSFAILGMNLKETFEYDFRWSRVSSAVIALGAPLAIFLSGARDFIKVINITGGVFGALDIVLIMLIYLAAKERGDRKPEYEVGIKPNRVWIFIAAFGIAALYEILKELV